MNEMPTDWLDQLKREYPSRSGPMCWPRVFLKLRRALIETNWDQIMEGVKSYARYCREAGTEGSSFVVAPARFFEDEIYLERLTFSPPQSKEEIERARLAGLAREHMQRVVDGAIQAGSTSRPHPGESAAAFETRLRIEQDNQRPVRRGDGLSESIRNLAGRLRVAK